MKTAAKRDQLLSNPLFPLRWSAYDKIQKRLLWVILGLVFLHILSIEVTGVEADLDSTALRYLEQKGLQEKDLDARRFNKRGNNLWIHYLYYKKYKQTMARHFGFQAKSREVLEPKYPLWVKGLQWILGRSVWVPSNTLEIAGYLRRFFSSGIYILAPTKKLAQQQLEGASVPSFLAGYGQKMRALYQLELHPNRGVLVRYPVHFLDYSWISSTVEALYRDKKRGLRRLVLRYNPDVWGALGGQDAFLKAVLYDRVVAHKADWGQVQEVLKGLQLALLKVYTLKVSGQTWAGVSQSQEYRLRFDNFNLALTASQKALAAVDWKVVQVSLWESALLKHRVNTREYLGPSVIPSHIKKAFVLVEDDYYYIEARGIDPIGLFKATYNYFVHGVKKGNASITEQVYEMYLGQQKKGPLEKLEQILGAMYLSYYSKTMDEVLDLYVQSVPGSYWKDHNYGIQGILRSYLGKNSVQDLNTRELAWITRLGLSPNIFGQDYVRFMRILKVLQAQGLDWDSGSLKRHWSGWIFLKKLGFGRKRLLRLSKAYQQTNRKIQQVLKEFLQGNEIMRGIINDAQYQKALAMSIQFKDPLYVNQYQSYTDQTLKDLVQVLSPWALNCGLEVEVSFDQKAQKVLERELEKSAQVVHQYKEDPESRYQDYGGGALLVKTHNIAHQKIANKIVAIASKHVGNKRNTYFNWVVDGQRHFGSIFKWIVLMLYLDQGGTLLDTFYDIPRTFRYSYKDLSGKTIEKVYQPNNWRRRQDLYGFFTFEKQDNVYNFIQSKNNTFVRIAELVGLEKIRDVLNHWSDLSQAVQSRKFQAIYPVVLGSKEISGIRFAQINAVIANQGRKQTLTTIEGIYEPGFGYQALDMSFLAKQVVSREAAEQAFYGGYLNTFSGTAKRFIKGGVGKTGSSPTDVSFLAMTGRTKDQYIASDPGHLLNHNLLYLVNIGVDMGKIDEGLYGGTVAALNAKAVFERLLKDKATQHAISGDFTQYFSKKLTFRSKGQAVGNPKKPTALAYKRRQGLVPVLAGLSIWDEQTLSQETLDQIRQEYTERLDKKFDEEYGAELAQKDGLDFETLEQDMQDYYKNKASMQRYYQGMQSEYQDWLISEAQSSLDFEENQPPPSSVAKESASPVHAPLDPPDDEDWLNGLAEDSEPQNGFPDEETEDDFPKKTTDNTPIKFETDLIEEEAAMYIQTKSKAKPEHETDSDSEDLQEEDSDLIHRLLMQEGS